MKLSAAQIEHTLPQIGAQAIPDDHPAATELKGVFGDHTFFLGQNGLSIVETSDEADDGALANVVNLASWSDDDRTALAPHRPEVTELVVEVGPENPDRSG